MHVRAKAEEGAAVVEFSLVASLIVVVAWGVIQFGIVYNRTQGLQAAGREGARFATSSQATIGGIQDHVMKALEPVFDTGSSAYVNPCPADPTTLSVNQYCINVARRNSPGATPTLLTVTGYSAQTQPCNLAEGKTIIVSVYHKMRVSIPLWATSGINGSGAGEFKCES
jgi:Flp pilus assembly protein TadG